jgi:hypothetical protein
MVSSRPSSPLWLVASRWRHLDWHVSTPAPAPRVARLAHLSRHILRKLLGVPGGVPAVQPTDLGGTALAEPGANGDGRPRNSAPRGGNFLPRRCPICRVPILPLPSPRLHRARGGGRCAACCAAGPHDRAISRTIPALEQPRSQPRRISHGANRSRTASSVSCQCAPRRQPPLHHTQHHWREAFQVGRFSRRRRVHLPRRPRPVRPHVTTAPTISARLGRDAPGRWVTLRRGCSAVSRSCSAVSMVARQAPERAAVAGGRRGEGPGTRAWRALGRCAAHRSRTPRRAPG